MFELFISSLDAGVGVNGVEPESKVLGFRVFWPISFLRWEGVSRQSVDKNFGQTFFVEVTFIVEKGFHVMYEIKIFVGVIPKIFLQTVSLIMRKNITLENPVILN